MTRITRRSTLVAALVGVALLSAACSSSTDTATTATSMPVAAMATTTTPTTARSTATTPAAASKDIVDTAVGAGDFTTLAKLLTSAGLVDTLKGAGPFTVFAPTDAAFAKVPQATLDALAKDPAQLKAVLTYHVVPGKVMAADVQPGPVTTVEGQPITISIAGSAVKVNDATVTKTDITTSNGVIHVIDSVLIPPAA
jgi:uncharacterized surface protein with fasciclin (FAS1) repeats